MGLIQLHPFLDGTQNPGEYIVARCAELGVTITAIAREAGVDRSTIHRWTEGRQPHWNKFQRVHRALEGYWSRRESRSA
jgi:hypothetical protein